MPLTLLLQTRDPALEAYANRRFAVDTAFTIGRGPENDLVLPDPSRVLSKRHCVVQQESGGYVVIDCSTNGVFLNNGSERLPREVPTPLGPGDQLQLGDFTLLVEAITAAAPVYQPLPPPSVGAAAADPFDDLLGGLTPAPAPALTPIPEDPLDFGIGSGGVSPLPKAGLAIDDPLFGFGAAPGATADEDPLFGGRGAPSAKALLPDEEDMFGKPVQRETWQGHSEFDHAASPSVAFVPPRVGQEVIPDDWDPLSDSGGSDLSVPAAQFPPAPAANVFAEPRDVAPPVQRPAPAAAPPTSSAADKSLLASFLRGLGMEQAQLPEAQAAAVLETAGRMLQMTIRGLMEILAARASTKEEFRIERTVIGARGNNPLKFSASPEEAAQALLLLAVPGFLTGEKALAEALDDIKAHELAVLAGMQVALSTLIGRFDPKQLEQRIERSSILAGILPGARKAQYWETFVKLYKEIARELEDDFQGLFGNEFARAYKAQIDRL